MQTSFPVAPTASGQARLDGTDLLLPGDIVDTNLVRALDSLRAIDIAGRSGGRPTATITDGYVRTHPTASPFAVVTLAEHLLPQHHPRLPLAVAARLELALHRYRTAIDASSATEPPDGYDAPVPAHINASLRPYQKAALYYLQAHAGWKAFLADDAGLGKCVLPQTRIFLNGRYMPIGEVWDRYAVAETVRVPQDGIGEAAEPAVPLTVAAVQPDGTMRTQAVSFLYRQHIDEDVCAVATDNGAVLTATQKHKVLTHRGWVRLADVKVGDHIATPSQLPWHGLQVPAYVTRFLAWQIAEGWEGLKGSATSLVITLKGDETLHRLIEDFRGIEKMLKTNRPAKANLHPARTGMWKLVLGAREWCQWLEGQGYTWGHRSGGKTIPDFITAADLATVRLFLGEFFAAEGSISGTTVELTSASEHLTTQLQAMLLRLGVSCVLHPKKARATNGTGTYRRYWRLQITGDALIAFAKEVGFADPRKQERLQRAVDAAGPRRNPNRSQLPVGQLLNDLWVETGIPALMLAPNVRVVQRTHKGIARETARSVLHRLDAVLDGSAERTYAAKTPGRWTKQTQAAFANLDHTRVQDARDTINWMVDAQLEWTTVTAAETFQYRGWVYDLEVPGPHNYVAEGLVTHNTLMAIAAILRDDGAHLPAVIFCKATLKTNWEDEILHWAPELRVETLEGRKQWTDTDTPIPQADAYIINYELAHFRLEDLIAINPKAVVADESQMLMSFGVNDDWARAWRSLDDDGRKKRKKPTGSWRVWAINALTAAADPTTILLLSATPSPNGRHRELQPQLDIANRLEDLGGRDGFNARYERWCDSCYDDETRTFADTCSHDTWPERFHRPNADGSINARELNQRLRSRSMVRRSTLQVMGDLDPITTIELRLPMSPAGRKEYRQVEEEFVAWLKAHAAKKAAAEGLSVGQAVARAVRAAGGDHEHLMRLSYLRQAAARAKLPAALEHISTLTEGVAADGRVRKTIVFAWHREIQQAILEKLPNAPRILAATDMTGEQIRESKRRFQEDMDDPDARVIVLSLAAAAEGHTLTAAQSSLFVDVGSCQGATIRQAVGRYVGRANDPHSGVATFCIAEGTIDEPTMVALDAKRALMANVMDDGHTLEWGDRQTESKTDTDIAAESLEAWIDSRF
jgi:hypothetical protein